MNETTGDLIHIKAVATNYISNHCIHHSQAFSVVFLNTVSLKNIFEIGDDETAYVLLVINPHHMRLIGVPRVDMTKDELYERMLTHLERCERCLEEHFELTLNIKRVVRYDSLYALSRENKMRMAH